MAENPYDRKFWLKTAGLCVGVFAGVVLLLVARDSSDAGGAFVQLVAMVLGYGAVGLVVVWLIRTGVSGGLADRQKQATGQQGPGQFKITGIDRDSKMDTTWHTQAVSPENAKVKAELEGIIVTAVERVG